MAEETSKEPEAKTEENHERKFSKEQYDMLKRCLEMKDITEWNEWRKKHPQKDVDLDGQNFCSWDLNGTHFSTQEAIDNERRVSLKKTNFRHIHAEKAIFHHTYLTNTKFNLAHLQSADFHDAHLEGAIFYKADIRGASFRSTIVNGESSFWKCKVRRYCNKGKGTDFEGVALDAVRIDPGTKQLLEYNIRRKNWEEWYKEHSRLKWLVKPF